MKTIAVGDIHGSLSALLTLLEALKGGDDRLVFLGDYIDRGPRSRQVIQILLELSTNGNHIFLRGNHDEWLLRARTDKRSFKTWIGEGVGGKATLKSYGAALFDVSALSLIPDEHFAFLEGTRLFFQAEFEIFVHASLSWQEPEENDPQQLMWRSFNNIKPHPSGKRIVCGHTSQSSGLPLNKGYAVCIDTFCYGTGWLSALDVDSNQVIQANDEGQVRHFPLGEPPCST